MPEKRLKMTEANSSSRHESFSDFEATMEFISQLDFLGKGKKILEIGSGKGRLAYVLKSKGFYILASDIRYDFLHYAKTRYKLAKTLQFSGENIPLRSNHFDVIISIDVLEHMPNLDKHLSEIKRVLKNGGYFIIQTPNKPFNIFWNIISKSKNWRKWHPSLCSYFEIIKLLRRHNLEVKFYKINEFTQYTLSKAKKLITPLGIRILSQIKPRYVPIYLYPTFYVVAKKGCPKPAFRHKE